MVVFALPLFLSSIFQQLYNTMDTVIIGHTLGETALAAMGASAAIYDLLIGFAFGIGNGLAIVTARSYGSGNQEMLKKSVAVSIVIGAVVTIVITVLTRFILYPFLGVLNTPEEIIKQSYDYISTITLFIVVMFAYNLCAGILRAIGNSVMPLVFLIISSLLNIVLDLLFITRFHMGVQGAAVATVLAQAVSVVLCLIYIRQKAKLLIPGKEHFAWDGNLYREMVTQGLSMGFMSCVVNAGTAILQSGINGLGYLVIAGHTAARKLFQFMMMPFIAMSQTISTFVSQNRGAGQPVRIRKAMIYSYLYGVIVAIVMTLLMWSAAPVMVNWISGSSESVVLQNGSMYLRVVAPCLSILGVLNCTRNALQAIGQKILPLISSIIELIGKILFVLILIPRFQYMAVIFCEPVIWCFMTLQLVIAFWKNPFIRSGKLL
ncbi:MAG: MATE family efflux transporter [Lachnospiraceae bacterium]|nr:MATE family efflux transporter [Lachnospiraceae bacterium]